MTQYVTLNELINSAIAAEDAARTIYLAFKRMFRHHPPVAAFWQTMADDENEHARVLANVHGLVPVEALTAPINVELVQAAYELEGLNAGPLLDSISDLNDAYAVAYSLESSEINTVFNFLTIKFLPPNESYSIIASVIDPHLLRLAEFTRTFGDAEQCKKIPALTADSQPDDSTA